MFGRNSSRKARRALITVQSSRARFIHTLNTSVCVLDVYAIVTRLSRTVACQRSAGQRPRPSRLARKLKRALVHARHSSTSLRHLFR